MTEYILPVRTANAILQRYRQGTTYLVIEGSDDFTVYGKFFDKSFCELTIAHGNLNVIEVLSILDERGFSNALGIIDADFRVLDNEMIDNAHLFFTDFHDLELLIFQSPAFEIIISHYATSDKINSFLNEKAPKDLRTVFLELVKPLGYLKWANKRFGLGLTFKPKEADGNQLNFADFISVNTLELLSERNLIETVINYSRNKSNVSTSVEDSERRMNEIADENIDLLQLCNGHDIMNVISLSLRRKLSNRNSNAVKAEQIQREIFFAYDSRFFETTRLYAQLKEWELSENKSILRF